MEEDAKLLASKGKGLSVEKEVEVEVEVEGPGACPDDTDEDKVAASAVPAAVVARAETLPIWSGPVSRAVASAVSGVVSGAVSLSVIVTRTAGTEAERSGGLEL